MKKTLFALLAASMLAATATAQNITNRTWTDGLGCWQKANNGNYQFIGGYTDAGLDWELKSISGDKFKVVDAEFNMSGNGCNVTKMKITDGYNNENLVLVARNPKNVITALLAELKDWNLQAINVLQIAHQKRQNHRNPHRSVPLHLDEIGFALRIGLFLQGSTPCNAQRNLRPPRLCILLRRPQSALCQNELVQAIERQFKSASLAT